MANSAAAAHLLLFSSSVSPGRAFLEHALDPISEVLDGHRAIVFVPYARPTYEAYTARVQAALDPLGVAVTGLHRLADPAHAIQAAGALFVGGGNTFRLLRELQRLDLLEPVRRRVLAGELRYIGASAGTNVACPTLRTTNDMPIVQPASFAALGLIPFQINPHFPLAQAERPPGNQAGETREERIAEFLAENDVPVLGLREGAWLRTRAGELHLEGSTGARLFQRGHAPRELDLGARLDWLLTYPARFDCADCR